jgi:hypothetical protein
MNRGRIEIAPGLNGFRCSGSAAAFYGFVATNTTAEIHDRHCVA